MQYHMLGRIENPPLRGSGLQRGHFSDISDCPKRGSRTHFFAAHIGRGGFLFRPECVARVYGCPNLRSNHNISCSNWCSSNFSLSGCSNRRNQVKTTMSLRGPLGPWQSPGKMLVDENVASKGMFWCLPLTCLHCELLRCTWRLPRRPCRGLLAMTVEKFNYCV